MPSPDPIPLPVEEDLGPDLAQALSFDELQIIKYYAYWDLTRLTKFSKGRMQQLFLVSKPGGHPRPWNAISRECLSLLESFLKVLNEKNAKLAHRWESQGYRKTTFDRVTLQPPHLNTTSDGPICTKQKEKPWFPWVWDIFDKWSSDPNLELLLEDWQLHAWNIEALGNILCASYTDDKFGVVQKDLVKIIGCLADVLTVLERNGRLSATYYVSEYRRRSTDQRRSAIKEKLTTALGQIRRTFSDHLKDISLNENQKKLIVSC